VQWLPDFRSVGEDRFRGLLTGREHAGKNGGSFVYPEGCASIIITRKVTA